MNEHGKRVRWPGRLGEIERMTDGAAVIGAVVDQVVEHFFPAQRAFLAVDEGEVDSLFEAIGRQSLGIVLQPLVRCVEAGSQRFEGGQFRRIGRVVRFGAAGEPGAEQFFDADHVIQLLSGEVELGDMSLAVDPGHGIQGPLIGPGLVFEGGVEVHGGEENGLVRIYCAPHRAASVMPVYCR